MGNKSSKIHRDLNDEDKRLALQKYHGATAPLKHIPGADVVLEIWIHRSSLSLQKIPREIFCLILNFISMFEDLKFQDNVYWLLKPLETGTSDLDRVIYQTARKFNGMGVHHNILFGTILAGDIQFDCSVKFNRLHRVYTNELGFNSHEEEINPMKRYNRGKEHVSVGLVEPDFHDYLEQHMHKKSKHRRCVFRQNCYFDCNGTQHEYNNKDFAPLLGQIRFDISVNMKKRVFRITDSNGKYQEIHDLPEERVICFEVWDIDTLLISNQRLQWV